MKASMIKKFQKLQKDVTKNQNSCLDVMRRVNEKSNVKISESELVDLCNKLTTLSGN